MSAAHDVERKANVSPAGPSGSSSQPPSMTAKSTAGPGPAPSSSSSSNVRPTSTDVKKGPASTSAGSTSAPSGSLAPLLGIHDLEAVAQAAMGLDANGNPLPGNEESHRSLAEAVKRLSAMQNGTSGFARATGNYVHPHPHSPHLNYEQDQYQQALNSDGSPMKRFQCHLCDRAFARAYNLNTHLATHDPDPSKSKPFPCPYPSCKADGGRSFSRKHDLQRHVASTHEHEPLPEDDGEVDENGVRINVLAKLGLGTPGRKFRCEECGRAFVRRDALKRHQCMPIAKSSPDTASPAPLPQTSTDQTGLAGSVPAGLSLYTSTAPQPSTPSSGGGSQGRAQTNGSSDANPPFYPSGMSYESLTREVQDMAMQLVAQATSYNQTHTGEGVKTGGSNGRSATTTAGLARGTTHATSASSPAIAAGREAAKGTAVNGTAKGP